MRELPAQLDALLDALLDAQRGESPAGLSGRDVFWMRPLVAIRQKLRRAEADRLALAQRAAIVLALEHLLEGRGGALEFNRRYAPLRDRARDVLVLHVRIVSACIRTESLLDGAPPASPARDEDATVRDAAE